VLRRSRGDAAGVELGASLADRLLGERGNHPAFAGRLFCQDSDGQARFRLLGVGWGGGCVVVAGVTTRRGVRESRMQGEDSQQVSSDGWWNARSRPGGCRW
jgi:hypothetical protein